MFNIFKKLFGFKKQEEMYDEDYFNEDCKSNFYITDSSGKTTKINFAKYAYAKEILGEYKEWLELYEEAKKDSMAFHEFMYHSEAREIIHEIFSDECSFNTFFVIRQFVKNEVHPIIINTKLAEILPTVIKDIKVESHCR